VSITLCCPELIAFIAFGEYSLARLSRNSIKRLNSPRLQPWTLTHSFFADIGGYVLESQNLELFSLNGGMLEFLVQDGLIELLDTTKEEIKDRTKKDSHLLGIYNWIYLEHYENLNLTKRIPFGEQWISFGNTEGKGLSSWIRFFRRLMYLGPAIFKLTYQTVSRESLASWAWLAWRVESWTIVGLNIISTRYFSMYLPNTALNLLLLLYMIEQLSALVLRLLCFGTPLPVVYEVHINWTTYWPNF
jgi:hypothetical protein